MGAAAVFSRWGSTAPGRSDTLGKITPAQFRHRFLVRQAMTQDSDFEPGINQRIWQVIHAIPPGRVCTYGEVARLAGLARAARRVGAALKGLPKDTTIPWHRVINAQGRISLPPGSASYAAQRERLESEGVEFRLNGSVELKRFAWTAESSPVEK